VSSARQQATAVQIEGHTIKRHLFLYYSNITIDYNQQYYYHYYDHHHRCRRRRRR